ncbi:TlpA family protein disulfide reductase [Aquihabitans daechungensis]|uniref:TlpA family protein disulfide reductase n=1 Tax=Aquihabitans daechungensis TaxID=1052257 RepID=UPI003BA0AD27
MADLPEPAVDDPTDAAEPVGATSPARGGRRSLDGRTVAICALIGLIAAIVTALIASAVLSEDEPTDAMQLQDVEQVDTTQLFAQPLDTPEGGETTLAAFREGKPTLVNLFASNCVPCVDEMPLLTDAQADNPDITFVGVATQDDVDKAQALVDDTGIEYPWALDPTGEFYYEAKGAGMPTTLLISADGEVLDSTTGAFESRSELQAFLDQAG